MGYYSDIAIALTRNGVLKLKEKLSEAASDTAHEVNLLLQGAKSHYADPATKSEVWLWKCAKWYQGEPVYYPEINFMEDLLDSLDEEDFRFIRIGEDYDDTEVRGEFTENPFDLELAREISLAVPDSGIGAKELQNRKEMPCSI